MNKYVSIDFNKCKPHDCYIQFGNCPSAENCSRGLLEQEKIDENPILLSASMCVGCGDCVRVCPHNALSIIR